MDIFPFSPLLPNSDLVSSADLFFDSVSSNYVELKQSGFFHKHVEKGLFIYEIVGKRSYTGVISTTDTEAYEQGNILGHEKTLQHKEQELMHLMMKRNAMIKPILLAYPNNANITTFLENYKENNTPFAAYYFDIKKENHTIWYVQAQDDLSFLIRHFAQIKQAFIADGHHRTAITSQLIQKSYLKDSAIQSGLLTAYFSDKDLDVYEYNRIVTLSPDFSPMKLLAGISKYADIRPLKDIRKPDKLHELILLWDREYYRLRWKPKVFSGIHSDQDIDVDLFNTIILSSILGIQDIRTCSDIHYVSGMEPLHSLQNMIASDKRKVGFLFNSLTIKDIFDVATRGHILPPKSSWFEPRMLNGLVVKEF